MANFMGKLTIAEIELDKLEVDPSGQFHLGCFGESLFCTSKSMGEIAVKSRLHLLITSGSYTCFPLQYEADLGKLSYIIHSLS